MEVSGPADGRGKELMNLGKRTRRGTSTADSHFSFPKAHLVLTSLAACLSLSEYRMPEMRLRPFPLHGSP